MAGKIPLQIDARKLSYDMALALRERPYSMGEFIADLAAGNISKSNVDLRRHFVMRDMTSKLGKDVTVDDFTRELLELVAYGPYSPHMLEGVNGDVLSVLKLDLALQR